MAFRYRQHYTVEEARALLPRLRRWLEQLNDIRREMDEADRVIAPLINTGQDLGGSRVNRLVKAMIDLRVVIGEFRSREIQIKDIERGLIDFPAIIGGREVFLCWEKDEPDIEHWHDLDTGYGGREKL